VRNIHNACTSHGLQAFRDGWPQDGTRVAELVTYFQRLSRRESAMIFKSTYLLHPMPKCLMIFAATSVITWYLINLKHTLYRPLSDRGGDITVGFASGTAHDTLTDIDRTFTDLQPASFENRYPAHAKMREVTGISTTGGSGARSAFPRSSPLTIDSSDRVASTFLDVNKFCRQRGAEYFGLLFTSCASQPLATDE
jgi:hypothetical protein